jgi:hypothetical protein
VAYEIDGLFVAVAEVAETLERRCLRVTVSGQPRGLAVSVRGRRGGGVRTGDPDFDRAVRVDGPPLETAARLDAGARAALREALDGGTFADGVWTADVDPLRSRTVEGVAEEPMSWVVRLLAAARIWVRPSTPAASLTAIAQTDPVPGVRARALLLLATIDPSLTVARQVAGIDGLASTEVDRLVAAALIAQGEGTGADVPALRAAAARLGASPEREAVELAIEAIQARVGAGNVGVLSATNPDGELSVAADGDELSVGRRG